MLSSLRIENIAIIEKASIDFGDGLNVMSGETGAGKSIILDSVNALLGERTSKELIRTGESNASVSGLFSKISDSVKDAALNIGIPSDDDEMMISRTINRDGKNLCRINGEPVTVGMLKLIGKELISIHGQHDNQVLLDPESHCSYIDAMADDMGLISHYRELFERYSNIKKQLTALTEKLSDKEHRTEILTYQVNELNMADIKPGERDEINRELSMFRNSESIAAALNDAYIKLSGDSEDFEGIVSMLLEVQKDLESVSDYMTEITQLKEKFSENAYLISECKDEIRDALDKTEYDPQRQEALEERLDLLYKLSKKYGETEEEMLAFRDNAQNELSQLNYSDEAVGELQIEEKKAYEELCLAADELTDIRERTSEDFDAKVKNELCFLSMPGVMFETHFETAPLSLSGRDKVEFLLSPNPGEDLKPLSKIASGGELSRIMLALKSVLSDKDNIETLVFDEIDTGVSGDAAKKIAIKLHETAAHHQVICVTHSPQIAAYADIHFNISKEFRDGKTFTAVEPLDYKGRVYEIARIIGGSNPTQLQKNNAAQMIESAKSCLK